MSAYQYNRAGDPLEASAASHERDLASRCNELRDRLNKYFVRWERANGFRPGSGVLLVPAGWRPKQ